MPPCRADEHRREHRAAAEAGERDAVGQPLARHQQEQRADGFEAVPEGSRVVLEHLGWGALPPEHAARHGFPLFAFQQRLAEWWRELLTSLADRSVGPTGSYLG